MSAQDLRQAAARIRDVAAKATPGSWRALPYVYGPPEQGWGQPSVAEVLNDDQSYVVSHQPHEGGGASIEDAEHIALFDPIVAKLLANVFDQWERMVRLDADLIHRVGGPEMLALARAILKDGAS